MKFLDFLQDVTAVGVVLALSAFLIDTPGELDTGTVATGAIARQADERSTVATSPSTDLLDELDKLIDSVVADPADDRVLPNDHTFSRAETPAPLDLDALEKTLDDQLGLADSTTARRQTGFRPEEFQPVELPEDPAGIRALPSDHIAPAKPSRPVAGVDRAFDDSDLFDDVLATGQEFSTSPPPPTRRLGPVEMLTPPSN